jgi:hypothetical protein
LTDREKIRQIEQYLVVARTTIRELSQIKDVLEQEIFVLNRIIENLKKTKSHN